MVHFNDGEEIGCPGVEALQALADGRKRFCQLKSAIGSVNSVTLTRCLRQMEAQAILVREVLNSIPPWWSTISPIRGGI